jgi:two-component system sensor histidine kinase KdpD
MLLSSIFRLSIIINAGKKTMRSIGHLLLLGAEEEQRRERYIKDALLATTSAMVITGGIAIFHLYPKIPNISTIYLLVVLWLSSTRGLYAAVITSITAFISFDFFLVHPTYTFTVSTLEEWLALFIFLVTAIITGQLASALRQRAEQAIQRESEARALYELVSATTSEESLERQLHIIAQAIVNNFAFAGVCDCAILLPDAKGKLLLRADACQPLEQVQLSLDEEATASTVVKQGIIVDLYNEATVMLSRIHMQQWFRRAIRAGQPGRRYIRMIPLRIGQHSVGVMRLSLEDNPRQFIIGRSPEIEKGHLNPQSAFFWAFLDQATSAIERTRLHQENLQVEVLQRTDALRSALLSSVSHDLRTPLSSIKAAASSLLQQDVHWDEETRRSFAVAIEHEADRLNRLVGNLLDMSRIEGGALKLEKEWYPLDELIYDVLGHMQFLLEGREIERAIPDDLPPVQLDYLQMDQVFTNLLENAARYTAPGSPIEISTKVVGDELIISIADHGPGIPRCDLERIFDKFYRVLGTKRKGTSAMGSGLGLAVCRGLVEAHGGRIWAENREEGGANFRFTLPLGHIEKDQSMTPS